MNEKHNWIQLEEGLYFVEKAYLIAPDNQAVQLQDARIEIYIGRAGHRLMRGFAKVKNMLIVELLEENDRIDLLVDMGGEFKYRLENPVLKAGKVFTPDVSSTLQFVPNRPWRKIAEDAFEQNRAEMVLLNCS